jgi:hypothetical protein
VPHTKQQGRVQHPPSPRPGGATAHHPPGGSPPGPVVRGSVPARSLHRGTA